MLGFAIAVEDLLDIGDFREFTQVRWMEYLPFFVLLVWAAIMLVKGTHILPPQTDNPRV